MKSYATLGGIGGIVFGVLTFVALLVGAPAGGNYSASDVATYVKSSHHAAVFVSVYLITFAGLGLILLLGRLRQLVMAGSAEGNVAGSIVWGLGLASAVLFLAGWAIDLSPPIAYAFASGGGFALTTSQVYAIVQIGNSLIFGPGGILLGLTLIVLGLGARTVFPPWLRWVTLVAGVLGLASISFFLWFVLLIWGVIVGIWLLTSSRSSAEIAGSAGGNTAAI